MPDVQGVNGCNDTFASCDTVATQSTTSRFPPSPAATGTSASTGAAFQRAASAASPPSCRRRLSCRRRPSCRLLPWSQHNLSIEPIGASLEALNDRPEMFLHFPRHEEDPMQMVRHYLECQWLDFWVIVLDSIPFPAHRPPEF
ncbi:MAG: hypothetical protein IJP80_05865 [Bacteroidales bacterium]|nr:hypothetical protein [Bacteroidales bacterium]